MKKLNQNHELDSLAADEIVEPTWKRFVTTITSLVAATITIYYPFKEGARDLFNNGWDTDDHLIGTVFILALFGSIFLLSHLFSSDPKHSFGESLKIGGIITYGSYLISTLLAIITASVLFGETESVTIFFFFAVYGILPCMGIGLVLGILHFLIMIAVTNKTEINS